MANSLAVRGCRLVRDLLVQDDVDLHSLLRLLLEQTVQSVPVLVRPPQLQFYTTSQSAVASTAMQE